MYNPKTGKLFLPFIFLLLPLSGVFAQATIPAAGVEITKAIPASPDAAALGKYGSIPVSPYTGVPDISIPLYTIKTGAISLPVSLSYHAGGNKVEESASSVGLGWALNCGGVITRTIRGKADEDLYGYLDACHCAANAAATIAGGNNLTQAQLSTYLNEISDGTMDGEADMYNYNFGGYSGRFVMDTYGNITTIPLQRINFSFVLNQSGPDGPTIESFTATTPDGTTYYFGVIAGSGVSDALETSLNSNSCSPVKAKIYATSWFVKKIIDATGHEVDFTYTNEVYNVNQAPNQTAYQFYNISSTSNYGGQNGLSAMPMTSCAPITKITGARLSTVTFDNGSIIFHTSPRNDLPGSTLIDSLMISGSGLSKAYRLYYTNNSSSRLRLDSLAGYLETASNGIPKKEMYRFQYSADTWQPGKLFNQDYWGYNNGQFGNANLIPGAAFTPYNTNTSTWLPGANRNSDETSMLGGMLTRITYPTGGYTQFTYEANRQYNAIAGSSEYVAGPNSIVAKSNDTTSIYYHYDTNHGNPTDTLTISSVGGDYVPVGMFASGLGTGDCNTNCLTGQFNQLNSSGQKIATFIFKNGDTTVYVPPGHYQVVLLDGKNQAYPTGTVLYSFGISWSNIDTLSTSYKNYVVGGLRIKQIADYDGINPNPVNLKSYQYTLPGQTYSSGWTDYLPTYNYYMSQDEGNSSNLYTVTYFAMASVSNYPLSTTQGSVVGYSHVTEFDGGPSGPNGKIEYYYTNSQTNPDFQSGVQYNMTGVPQSDNGFPFSPTRSMDWHRGLLTRQITWRASGSGYAKLKDDVKGYGTAYSSFTPTCIKAGFYVKPLSYNESNSYINMPFPGSDGVLSVFTFSDLTDFTYLSGETETDYSSNDTTRYTQTTTNYTMDPSTLQVAGITTTNSKNEKIIQTVTYPPAYSTAGITGNASMRGLSLLQSKGILSYPVEEVTQRSNADGSNLRTIKAVLTTYKPTMPVRDSVYEMRSVTPVTAFTASTAGTTAISKDSHYQPVVSFDKYDSYSNIVQEHKVGDVYHSYIWGYPVYPYNNTRPIAEVINADSTSIAYTNFESYDSNGLGNWVYSTAGAASDGTAPMGSGCYTVSSANTVTKSALTTATKYVVSFWAKSGAAITVTGGTVTSVATGNAKSGWSYHEYSVTGTTSVIIGGTGLIDELRLYPVSAEMSTYTYSPLVGITAKCDTKNDITYYNYDNVGRLTSILDQNRNIIKDYQYSYASTSPAWVDLGSKTCVQGTYGNTGEELKEQEDMNPYSPTYKQTQWVSMGQQIGDCPLPVFIKIRVTGTSTAIVNGFQQTYNTFEADAFSDAACTMRYTQANALTVDYYVATSTVYNNGNPTTNTSNVYTATMSAGSSSVVIGTFDVSGCAPASGSGGGPAVQQAAAATTATVAQPQSVGGGGGGATACSTTTVTVATGVGYTPEN